MRGQSNGGKCQDRDVWFPLLTDLTDLTDKQEPIDSVQRVATRNTAGS